MELDLFLFALMREYPELRARVDETGIRAEEIARVKQRAQSAGMLSGFGVTKDTIVDLFGRPEDSSDLYMSYGLSLWPQHRYRWAFGEDGYVFYDIFVLKSPVPEYPDGLPLETLNAQTELRVGFHTIREVEHMLGPPMKFEGWGMMEDWSYHSRSGDDLILQFDFGLLTGIRPEKGAG